MLVEQRNSMLGAARGVASRVRRCKAAWGCARFTTECHSQPQPSRAAPPVRTVCQQTSICAHARRNLTTFAAASTRETATLLDPGDYEAGQIQVQCRALQFRFASLPRSLSKLSLHVSDTGFGRPRPSSQAPWHVHRQHWSTRLTPLGN